MKDFGADFERGARPLPLEEMALLLSFLGSPHMGMKYVHIAGTNGKGSTAAFLESILRRAGYKTGLFTSPHIASYNERIRVNGVIIGDGELNKLQEQVDNAAKSAQIEPNFFQAATAAAFLHFKRESCDIVILETGLGGRLDPTNVIDAPEAAVITRIGPEHMALLGDTISAIAHEKAGIIKKGSDVIYIAQDYEAEEVIRARDGGAVKVSPLRPDEYSLGLAGAYQLENAALAVHCARALAGRGYSVTEDNIRAGLNKARWEARFETVHNEPVIILDGAHNPQAVRALKKSLIAKWPDKRFVFIAGFMADKAYKECIREMAGISRAMTAVEPESERALKKRVLAGVMSRYCDRVAQAESMGEAIEKSLGMCRAGDIICVYGSLYLAEPVKDALEARRAKSLFPR